MCEGILEISRDTASETQVPALHKQTLAAENYLAMNHGGMQSSCHNSGRICITVPK
jgi:hypothetical protein